MKESVRSNSRLASYVDSNAIYSYFEDDHNIYKFCLDGHDKTMIYADVQGTIEEMFVVRDEICYSYMDQFQEKGATLYLERVSTNGDGIKQTLCDDVLRGKYSETEPVSVNNWIYYEAYDENLGYLYYKVRHDGTMKIKLIE